MLASRTLVTMTPRSMKGIPEHSVQCPLGVRFFSLSASPVARTSREHALYKILREPLPFSQGTDNQSDFSWGYHVPGPLLHSPACVFLGDYPRYLSPLLRPVPSPFPTLPIARELLAQGQLDPPLSSPPPRSPTIYSSEDWFLFSRASFLRFFSSLSLFLSLSSPHPCPCQWHRLLSPRLLGCPSWAGKAGWWCYPWY